MLDVDFYINLHMICANALLNHVPQISNIGIYLVSIINVFVIFNNIISMVMFCLYVVCYKLIVAHYRTPMLVPYDVTSHTRSDNYL